MMVFVSFLFILSFLTAFCDGFHMIPSRMTRSQMNMVVEDRPTKFCTPAKESDITSLFTSLTWRRSLRNFVAPPPSNIKAVVEAARLAPTSYNVEPFHIHVVSDVDFLQQLKSICYNQQQVGEASHVLVFTALTNAKQAVDRVINAHNLEEKAPKLASSMKNGLLSMENRDFFHFASEQAHIALGFSLIAAATARIGSCPIGSFDVVKLKDLLQLPQGQIPVVLLALGGAPDENDVAAMEKSSPYPRYRLPLDQLVTYVGGGGEGVEGEGPGHREKLTERLHHQLTTPMKETPTMKQNEKKETTKTAKATCAPKVVVDNDIDVDKEEAAFSYIRTASDVIMDIKEDEESDENGDEKEKLAGCG